MSEINNIPEKYRPITMWGYFGYQVLFSIPVVGFVFLVVYALGGTKNVNKRNFARSYFCYLLILIVIMAVLVATGLVSQVIDMFRGMYT
ncbi:MAG: hypothetical protein K6G24_03750 [Lachnospiraceae bacterium]|nr:hypothetical protein [Clostridiales bacterium]MCR5726561.1 hypothetical protein [Lachnospiraceae bacterium]